MGDVLKKFGRYFLLDHIAQGGMAEIYRARLAAMDGANRLLVIKRIQAGFGHDNEFVQMFRSETQVMMGFNHPNIIQTYDFGEENGQPYIAMEFVDGRNLRQMSSRFNERKSRFPIEIAAHIIEQAACGLHYAHSFKDKISGQPLNLVHRDVSPQNLLISYEGSVKVIDFGIAKTTINHEATRAGVIKGKPSYLSPEQISGEVLDGRSDIFSLGTVLWELLTGKKLFAAESDLGVLKLIECCQTHVKPPSTLNPKVPKELDYIVLKCLTKDRKARYQTAEELQRALHKFLYSYAPDFNPADLSVVVRDLFKDEIIEDRKKLQRLNDEAEKLLTPAQAPEIELGATLRYDNPAERTVVVEKKTTQTVVPKKGPEMVFDANSANGAKIELEGGPQSVPAWNRPGNVSATAPAAVPPTPVPGQAPSQPVPMGSAARPVPIPGASRPIPRGSAQLSPLPITPGTGTIPHGAATQVGVAAAAAPAKSGIGKLLAPVAAALIGVVVLGKTFHIPVVSELLNGSGQSARTDVALTLEGAETGVSVTVNGRLVANALPATLKNLPVGAPVRVTVTGANGTFQQEFVFSQGEKKSIPVSFVPERALSSVPNPDQTANAAVSRNIILRVNLVPCGGHPSVTINGKPMDAENPVVRVPMDEPLELIVERKGFHIFRREFVLESRQLAGLKETLVDVPLEPLHPAMLSVHTTPSADAVLSIDGKACVIKTPFDGVKLPAGTYDIKLVNDLLGMEKKLHLTLEEGTVVTREERLELKD